jgi:class 3 adenylate cyclase
LAHRRRLLAAIAALREKSSPPKELTAPIAAPTAKEDVSGLVSSSAERRQLTVMFCDLVGSTALSARLDPEDLREVIGAYHRAAADVVKRLDGYVAKCSEQLSNITKCRREWLPPSTDMIFR